MIFSEGVTVRDTPQVGLTVGAARRQANYKRGSSTTALLFQYTVQAADEDTDGASINANGLTRNNGSIKKNNATTSAHLAHGPVANQSAHKVDGVVPTLAHAEVTGDELNLSYGEVLDDDPKPAPGDFAVTVDGTARSVAVVGVNGSAVTLTLASAATSGQGVKLTYTPGTDPIRDRAQNPADALTNRTVSNLAQGNKRPVFNDGSSATRLVAENTAAGQDIQQPVSATDEDGHDLTYRLGGDDAADFAIDEFTGQLRTRSGVSYDYEAKSGYSLTVTVDDGHGGTSTIAVGIQVVDVNEPPSAPPSMLLLSAGNGQISISWSASPNEIGKPPVSGYELQRRLGEKGKWEHAYSFDRRDDTDILLVNVTNDVIHYFQVRTLNDEGESGWSKPVSGTLTAGPQVASAIPKQTLVLGGADVDVDLAQAFTHPSRFPMTYDAESSNDDVATVTVSDSIATLSPVRVGYETITATASDERDNEARSTFTITVAGQPPEPPPPPPPGNKLPVFNDGTTTTRMFAENPAEGQDIGDPVNATDEDGHGLTYRLGGDDAANFGIDSGTGQLRTLSGVTYDHETKSGFTVIITTDDGNGGIAAIGVTIFVVDVDESPDRPLAPILSVSDDSRRLSVRPNPSLPVNTGPDITGWEIQIAAKGSGDFYGYSPFPEPDWIQPNWNVVIPDLIPTWVYEVQLRARSDEGPSEWSPSAEATIPNERPVAKRGIRNVTLTAGAAALAISLEKVFSDPDGFTLTASSNNEPVATAEKYGSSVLIHPIATGTATITVTATDPWGLSGTRSFNVEIEAPVLQAHTLSIADSVFTFGFTDAFNASETRAYDVRIRHKTPIGPWATRCISVTNPDNIAQDVTTSRQIVASDFFEPGTTYEADFVHRGAGCDDVPSGLYSPKTEATTAGTPSFDIHVVYPEGALPLSYTRSIEEAVARWERIITDGIPNYRRSDANIRRFESGYPGLDVPEVVDDLMIFMDLNPYIANVAAVYGLFKRPSVSLLPWYCSISLNPSFMDESSHEGKTTTIGHEIGHCLGVCAAGVFTKGDRCRCRVRRYVGNGMMSFGRGHRGRQSC